MIGKDFAVEQVWQIAVKREDAYYRSLKSFV